MVPLFGAAYTDLGLLTVLITHVNGKIQGLFKAFECFPSTFQGKFNFQGLFKTVLYIQVLFKPVRTLRELKWLPDPLHFEEQKTYNGYYGKH